MELRPHIQLPQQHVCSQGGPGHDTGLFGLPADRTNIMQAVERGTSRNFDGSRRPLWPVKLKVFDISKGMAELYGGFFVSDKKKGIWHTNVVVFGLEYFYVSTICVCPVGMGWPGEEQLKEVLDMGTTERTVFELEAFLRAQQRVFTPNKYDMFKHNCNHFSDLVLRFLNYRLRVPSYIASLPERVLQTTLGRLVYPLVNAALDRTKSEICQHADKAELCGEIFFYGGATPLLLPGERSTRALVKRVMEEFKQQQRETVAHRSSIATCRSKSSSRSGQCSQGSAFFGSRSTSQNAAAVTAAYSDAVIARRRERTRYPNDEDSRWSSQHRHGEVQRQRQQRQQQTRHLQWQPDYVLKKRAQSGSTALGRGVSSRHTTAAAGDDLPAATDEALPYAVGEEFFTLGEADSHGEEQTDYEAPPVAIKEAEELPHWEDNRSSSSAWHQPPRRERSHISAVHSAGGAKANDTEQPEETQGGGQALWGSSSGSDSKYLCQWKSHADFLHATDDTSSSTAGAGPAGEAQYKTKRPARRLRGVTSVAWSDCSTSSEASRPRTSLTCGTSGERVCRRVGTRVVGPLTTATSIREEELPFCDAFESRNKDSSWSPITGSLLRLVDRAHQRGPGARPNSRSARRGKYGSSNSRQAPELRGTPTENAPPMTVSSSSTTVDSRLSTYSGTSPSSSNTYARKGLERHFSTRNSASFGEDPRAGDRSNYAPAQSVQVRDQQRTSGAGNVAAVLRYRTSASPSAARDTHRARRRSVSETNSSTLPSARDLWKCVAGDDSADVEPLRFSRTDSGIRRCSSGWRRNNCEYEPGDGVCGSRRPPFSRRHHSLSAPTSIGAGENKVDLDEEEQNRSCGTRRHIITSGVLAPVEGDIAAEDVHGSTQSSIYSSFSEAHDSCDDSVAQPVQRWLGEREEVQYEQNDQTQARRAEQQDYRRNNEKQNLFVTSPEGRRTSLAAGRTCLGSPFSSLHASSASSGIFEPHPRVDGQKSELQSNIQRVPTAGSSSCSYIESADVVGREERLAAGRVGESFSATADEVDFSGPHSKVPVCEAAVPDPAAADESEPVWQDAEEEEEAETKDSREDRGQSEYSKEWLSAGPTRPAGIKAEAGKTSERRGVHPSELSPSDFNDALHLSASTAPPVSKYSSFESASDCCFLESAHEDDSEEEEGGQTFQEAKEERTGSDETAGSSRNKEKRAADRRQWRDWWHQQEQQHERNAACSPSVTTEVQQPKKGVSQRLLCDRFKQTDDLEQFRTSFFPTSSPALSPRCRLDNVRRQHPATGE